MATDGVLERVKGIEPSYEAWEAAVLPLNYTRSAAHSLAVVVATRALGAALARPARVARANAGTTPWRRPSEGGRNSQIARRETFVPSTLKLAIRPPLVST
jgi:hypothetical protein